MHDPLLSRPALRGDRLVFVSDDDLWTVSAAGGLARRLTSGLSPASWPVLSQDGQTLVFVTREEGVRDLYRMPADGGEATRLTWVGADPRPLAFRDDDREIVFRTTRGLPHREAQLATVSVDGGPLVRPGWGPGEGWSEGPGGRRVLCRNAFDLAHWKRYRGGRVGELWVDAGDGVFAALPSFGGNVASPSWVELEGDVRLLFVSDHEGVANLYSAREDGSDLRPHTFHTDRAVRHPVHDAGRVVYEHAGRLHRLDLADGSSRVLPIQIASQHARAQRRHIASSRHLEDYALHPEGHSLVLTIRGKPFVGGHWEGPLTQLGVRDGVRYRLVRFLDDTHLVWVSDAGGEEHLEVCDLDTLAVHALPLDEATGRLLAVQPGPGRRFALVDDRARVGVVTLSDPASDKEPVGTLRWLEAGGEREAPSGLTFSPDGRWLAWSQPVFRSRSRLRLADLDGERVVDITDGTYADFGPSFDPAGRWLVFLSRREFDPVPDRQAFGYSFPRGVRPYLVVLKDDQSSPFEPEPRALGKSRPPRVANEVDIDLDGITERIVRVPLPEARWSQVVCLPSGRMLLMRQHLKGSLTSPWKQGGPPDAGSQLILFDPETREQPLVYRAVSRLKVDLGAKTAAVQVRGRLRVIAADADKATRVKLAKNDPPKPSRASGWVDLGRARLQIDPRAEWRQMLDETWRMQRDNFWDPGMAGVDWPSMRTRYLAEAERVSTRAELTDLLKCLQGELGTSHAYEMGGDHRSHVVRSVGRLGADFRHDGTHWVVETLHRAEPGDPQWSPPLLAPGVRLVEGTRILAIDGQPLCAERPVESYLVGHAGRPVRMDVQLPEAERSTVIVRPLGDDTPLRYRSWVLANQRRVHEATDGRVGYVHVPDMGPKGFAAFHRDYLVESERGGLIVDVRYNGGGHVSQLLLSRLAFRRLAWTQTRHFGRAPYPAHPVQGPLVALANGWAGSDGDIFSHVWKQLELGPLIGTRTWGGVVGLRPRHRLADDTLVTQPEFAFWFDDVGYGIEGRGVDPDVEVQITPDDWAEGRDPQLEAAIEHARRGLPEEPVTPDLGPNPRR